MPPHVRSRGLEEHDLPVFFDHQRDPDANRMASFDARDRDAFMEHWAKILRDETVVVRTIELEGDVTGNIVSWEHDGERDVGYWIGRQYWGKSIATAALSASIAEVDTRPLYAHVAAHESDPSGCSRSVASSGTAMDRRRRLKPTASRSCS